MPIALTLTGTVADQSTGQGLSNVEVQIWPAQQGSTSPVATAVTDASGQFVAQLKAIDGLRKSVQFKVFQDGRQLKLSKDEITWGGRDANRTVTIPVLDVTIKPEEPEEPDPDSCVVRGRVLDANGPGIAQATVKAVHKKLRSEITLGQAITDKSGAYEIKYSVPQGEDHVDLILRAQDSKDEEIATSKLICHASKEETVDLIVGGDEYLGYSEYEKLVDAVSPHLDGASPESLSASDVAILACKTELEALNIAYYVVAKRNETTTGVTAAAFYAFSRMRLPTNLSSLLPHSDSVKQSALENALSQNIVPASLEDEIHDILSVLKTANVNLALAEPANQGEPSLTGLLSRANLSKDQQTTLLKLYSTHDGTIASFWEKVRSDPIFAQDGLVDGVQLALQLGTLTGNHTSLVEALQNRKTTSIKDLVSYDFDKWYSLVKQTGAPSWVAGDDADAQARTYAKLLTVAMERTYPSATVVYKIRNASTTNSNLVKFFDNCPDFDFGNNLERYFRDKADTAFSGIAEGDRAVVKAQLKSSQRLYKIGPDDNRYEAMTALQKSGLGSALDLARMGEAAAIKKFGSTLDEDVVKTMCAKAVNVSSSALAVFSKYGAAFNLAKYRVLGDTSETPDSSVLDMPTWEQLFGSIDTCACEDCRSVHSPSAYLVDTLEFLKTLPRTDDTSKTAYDLLDERRPDIKGIQLSCENSDTEIPYISLVLEILESVVQNKATTAYQTSWSAEELEANDEHFTYSAYDTTAGAVFPWPLPFDLWVEEARAYLGQLGGSLYEVLDVFQRQGLLDETDNDTDTEVGVEYLGISPAQQNIIIGEGGRTITEYWDIASTPTLSSLPTFLDKAGIEFADFLYLLEAKFINADSLMKTNPATFCSTDDVTIEGYDDKLDKIHRFLRLRRIVGLEIRELDEATSALAVPDLTNDFLLQLSHIQKLRTDLKLTLFEILSWWSNISTSTDTQANDSRSLYEQLFQNKAVINPVDPVFELKDDKSELKDTTQKIGDHQATIVAALEITEDELAKILAYEGLSEDATLNLSNLSLLYRNASLAQALTLSIEDFLSVRVLTGIKPFESGATAAAIDFVEQATAIKDSNFAINELDYLLRHSYEETEGVAPTESTITAFLDEVRDGLQKIAEENQFVSDPIGEVTQARLAILLTAEDLARAVAIIEGTSTETDDEKKAFIDEHFASFLADLDEAKSTLLAALDPANMTQIQERYEYILEPLVEYLRDTLSDQYVYQKVADALSLGVAVATSLLTDYILLPNALDLVATLSGLIEFTEDVDGSITRDRLSVVLSDADLATAMAILGGEPTLSLSEDEQRTFVQDHFALFISDLGEAKTKLVGTAALTAGQLRYEYVLQPLLAYLKGILLDWYVLVYKVGLVLSRFKVTSDELPWLMEPDKGPALGWLDLTKLPLELTTDTEKDASTRYKGWRRLVDLYTFRDAHSAGDTTVIAVLEVAHAETDAELLRAALVTLTGWNENDLATLLAWDAADPSTSTGSLGLSRGDCLDERFLVRLEEAFTLLTRLGMAATTVNAWKVPMDQTIAESIKNALKAKYAEESWPDVAESLEDLLREKRRDALVAYVMAENDFEDTNELYSYYLIDFEMMSCMKTSRMVQAHCSVQLFVQRCLLNLEAVSMTDDNKEQWEWRQQYRVWEAARKVFLYPESYIEPELRDDKSPFFKDLETELLQNEVTDETAETAFLHYLEKLDEVANLEICALYHQKEDADDSGDAIDIVHVVGRTYGTPPNYYYRQYVDGSYWAAWEKLDLDIEGDHLLLTVWNRRLYVIWAIFTEEDEGDDDATPYQQYLTMQLAWSEYKNEVWSAKKCSLDSLRLADNWSRIQYCIRDRIDGDTLIVEVLAPTWSSFYGKFTFSGCNRYLTVTSSEDPVADFDDFILPTETNLRNMLVEEFPWGDYPLELPSADVGTGGTYYGGVEYIRTLDSTPGMFQLAMPFQYNQFVCQDHFFYLDETRSFFVTPSQRDIVSFKNFVSGAAPYFSGPDLWSEAEILVPGSTKSSYGSKERASMSKEASGKGTVDQVLAPDEVDMRLASPVWDQTYLFQSFYHPYVCDFIKTLNRDGIVGLLNRDSQKSGEGEESFAATYTPHTAFFGRTSPVELPYPEPNVDFLDGAYSLYNWELFFHAPLLIADRLMQNQQFEEAKKWLEYIFDPTSRVDSSDVVDPQRYWNFYPFYQETSKETVYDLMQSIAEGDEDVSNQIKAWQADPFNVHLIARTRPLAYMKATVMLYIDNLIAWGDQLFGYDTMEYVNQATQLYILASEILGDRPTLLPELEVPDDKTYTDLAESAGGIDGFSNALIVQLENEVTLPSFQDWSITSRISALKVNSLFSLSLVSATTSEPYFCIPSSEELVKRWDTVEDRLYKIRNCMNIEGVERTLALYSPPISPALLVAAAAAGVDISSVLSDLYSPLPYYRFQIMLQKALEFCAEVRALGSALLSALEKEDAEELALVRASQESQLLSAMKTMKEKQVDEAEGNLDALNSSKEVTQARGNYYTGLVEDGLNDNEQTQLDKLMTAQVLRTTSQAYDLAAQIASLVPDASVGAPTCTCVSYGGSQLGPALRAYGSAYSLLSDIENYKATTASIKGGYDRRSAEWEFQITSATKELAQLDKQIAAAQLRVDIANEELTNHNKQVENAAAVYDLIKNKYTNQELYSWMVTQISALYFQSYQLAYNLGKRAERCYQHELAVDTTFIQFGYWDSLKKGLLAGERLQYDLRRMDAAYLENNKRTFELTKHVSLIQLDPVALLKLKETGECYVSLPEAIFDLDYAGHYQRRIKSVSLTIPCVTGPYSTLSCTLTLLSSSIRTSATANANGEDYSRNTSEEDARFKDYYGATQSIATSHGRQDSGLFELSFHDERYLPFEGGGVISQWRLELPTTFKAFDYSTISDVILHIQYTAKDGGSTLKSAAGLALEAALEALKLGKDGKERTGLFRAFSLRHEFPNEWYKLLHPTNGSDSEVTLTLDASRFPYRYQDKDLTITTVEVYVKGTDKALFYLAPPGKSVKDSNGVWDSDYEIELGTSGIEGVFYDLYAGGDQDVGEWTLAADEIQTISDQIEEIILVFGFTVEPQ